MNGPPTIGNYYTTQYADAWDAAVRTAAVLPELEERTLRFVRAFCESCESCSWPRPPGCTASGWILSVTLISPAVSGALQRPFSRRAVTVQYAGSENRRGGLIDSPKICPATPHLLFASRVA